ncbi:MAG: NmrA family protein [Microbacteriaceae bacterium]|nr:NmrA family protein [Microbacteriaceae bacterium]
MIPRENVTSRIVVTGANGEFGGGVARALLDAGVGELVATVRDPSRSDELRERGADVRAADFDNPDQLVHAFAGADVVLINATFFGTVTALREQRIANAIDATRAANVPRVVMTSWPDLEHCDLAAIGDYRASEARLSSTSADWTILRFGYGIADAVARDVMWAIRDGRLVAPAGSAVIRPAAVSDLIEATATVLTSDDHSREIVELRNPAAVDWNDLAGLASDVSARAIDYEPVDDEGYREYLETIDLNPAFADGLLELYRVIRSGWASTEDGPLERLLGRAAIAPLDAVRSRVRP